MFTSPERRHTFLLTHDLWKLNFQDSNSGIEQVEIFPEIRHGLEEVVERLPFWRQNKIILTRVRVSESPCKKNNRIKKFSLHDRVFWPSKSTYTLKTTLRIIDFLLAVAVIILQKRLSMKFLYNQTRLILTVMKNCMLLKKTQLKMLISENMKHSHI